jgi:hypothetical protein
MSARILGPITPEEPWGRLGSGAACSAACGFCGGCSSAWEREEDDTEVCADCLGSGEVIRCDGSDHEGAAVCIECDGKGWVA